MNLKVIFCISAILLLGSAQSRAITHPLRNLSHLRQTRKEIMSRVNTSRVIEADYDLIKMDFPELSDQTNAQIDQWLLENSGYISQAQAKQELVNTKIEITSETRAAYRPAGYGRAAVFPAGSGLLDIKGIGSLAPYAGSHANGLMSTAEALHEYCFEKLVFKVLKHSGHPIETIRTYAVVDWGFGVYFQDGKVISAAGAVLRQAHTRYNSRSSLFNETLSRNIESVLRIYGITSAGSVKNSGMEKINIQGTENEDGIIDFGAFRVRDHFTKPATHHHGKTILLDPETSNFIQPDPRLQIPVERWGSRVAGDASEPTFFDIPWMEAEALTQNFKTGNATRKDVEAWVKSLLDSADQVLDADPCNPLLGGKQKLNH